MHHRVITAGLTSLLLLSAVGAPAAAQATQDTTALSTELRAARGTLSEAFSRLDANAATTLFTADAIVEFNGQVFNGHDAIRAWFDEAFSGLSALRSGTATFVVDDGEVTERSGYVVTTIDGQEQGGSSESVWRRQEDGSWRIVRLSVM